MKKLFILIAALLVSTGACDQIMAKDPGYLGIPSSYIHRTDPPGPAYPNGPVGK